MMILEENVREALVHGAAQAPDPDAVLSGLDERIRVSRRRRRATVLSAGAVAAVAAVPMALTLPDLGSAENGAAVASGAADESTLYDVTGGLPTGYREVSQGRTFGKDNVSHGRTWSPASTWSAAQDGPQVTFKAISMSRNSPSFPNLKPGEQSISRPGPNTCLVTWMPSPKERLGVLAAKTGDECGVATRVARSVKRNPSVPLTGPIKTDPIRIDPRSEKHTVTNRHVYRTDSGCTTSLSIRWASSPGKSTDPIKYGYGALPSGGTPLTINGRPARYYGRSATPLIDNDVLHGAGIVNQYVVIDLGRGHILTVGRYVPGKEALIKRAMSVHVSGPPTCPWK